MLLREGRYSLTFAEEYADEDLRSFRCEGQVTTMTIATVELPDELLTLLRQSKLATRSVEDQVRIVLVMQLAQEGVISMGKAAELAGEPRAAFEALMHDLKFWPVQYDLEDYEQDVRTIANLYQQAEEA
jgi:predicted HTH domain antitoxin